MRANGKDPKKFWKSINDIIPNSKNNKTLINLINENTNEDVPTDQTADFINQYFIGIGPMLAAPLNQDWTYDGVIPDEIIAEITTNKGK